MANDSYILTFGETPDEHCRRCGGSLTLVTANEWKTHPEDEDVHDEWVEPEGEVSGHYCQQCHVLTGVFIHVPERAKP